MKLGMNVTTGRYMHVQAQSASHELNSSNQFVETVRHGTYRDLIRINAIAARSPKP